MNASLIDVVDSSIVESDKKRKNPNLPPLPPHSLLKWFQNQNAKDLVEDHRYPVPLDMWEHVLLGPAKTFLEVPGKSLRRTFIQLGWELAYNLDNQEPQIDPPPCPQALIALIELLHTGSLIIDDIEDQSLFRRGRPSLHIQIGLAPALNIGNWLYFVAGSMIEHLGGDPLIQLKLYQSLNRTMLRCHQGQALDVGCQVSAIPRSEVYALVNRSTQLKSGTLIGYALQLGALYLGKSTEKVQALYSFGEQIGQALQMYDDLSGMINPKRWQKGNEDLHHKRLTWVWSWLAQNPHLDNQTYYGLCNLIQGLPSKTTLDSPTHSPIHYDTRRVESTIHLFKEQALPYLPNSGDQMNILIDQAAHTLYQNLDLSPSASLHQALFKLKASYL